MTFFVYSGQPRDYDSLGFSVTNGQILDGTLSDPEVTSPPDANWSVTGSGPETVTRHGQNPGGTPSPPEPTDGYVLRYSGADNAYVATDPQEFVATKWKASTAYTAGDTVLAPDGSLIKSTANRTSSATFDAPSLDAPVLNAPTTATTGGTLAAATYFYKITAINAIGETVGSNEVSQATTGTTSTVGLSWAAITGATGYKIYRATTTGGQSTSPALLVSLGTVTTYTDTGTAVSAGAVPATNTTAEQAFWTAVAATPGTLEQVALSASFVPKWEASTSYGAGDVRLVQGMVGIRRTAGTSGGTTDAANWQIGTEPGNVPNVKPSTDTRAGVWELTHSSDTGYLYHLLAGSSFANPAALIALGMDNGNGTGILVANKASGVGITLRQQATIASSTAYALKVDGLSTTAPSVRIEQNVGGAGDALQLLAFSSGGAPTSNQRLLYVSDPNGEAWSIFASDGRMRGQRSLRLFANPGTAADSYLEVSTSTAANSSNTRKAYHASNGYTAFGSTGSAGVYYPYQVFHQSSALSLRVGATITAADPVNPLPSEVGTLQEVITMRYSGGARQIGFHGVTPVARATVAAAATDAATTQTLVNDLRTKLIDLGLVQ